ncbi:hypothetical protein [Paraburkholderia bannensis]|uniref:hypothetical protein n=1 Tax=Paraburkholderia bannensis TaxID=765414 RepID=UPI000484F41F|nr:hypothetical protein [Paraburkholderia bannensis]
MSNQALFGYSMSADQQTIQPTFMNANFTAALFDLRQNNAPRLKSVTSPAVVNRQACPGG